MSKPENRFDIMASDANYFFEFEGANYFFEHAKHFFEHWTPGKIFQLVEKLAWKYLKDGGVSGPPVSEELISLADKNSTIEVHLLPLKTRGGAVWKLNGRWVIQLRDKDTPATKRFTLFHEAFHILTHCHSTPRLNGPGKEKAYFNEILADYFSCCLLMPGAWVKEQWRQVNNVQRMADIFNVSESMIGVRLRQLHLI